MPSRETSHNRTAKDALLDKLLSDTDLKGVELDVQQPQDIDNIITRVLVVISDRALRRKLSTLLSEAGMACRAVRSAKDAQRALDEDEYDVALIVDDLVDFCGIELAKEITRQSSTTVPVIVAEHLVLDDAVRAMRAGAADLILLSAPDYELRARIEAAADRARRTRAREQQIDRLREICRKLNGARNEITRQVSSLCNDLVDAYQELSDQMTQVSVASEFKSLVRQDLDVESLLRTALEFILAKTGPTNAAVFLPSTSGDFALGAYVNYDCSRDSADVLLDHLADVIAPKIENEPDLLSFTNDDDLIAFLGDDAHWLAGSNVVTFGCRHDDECLAAVILFRDHSNPFSSEAVAMLRTITDLFAGQLARVIHIHNRHLPKDQWGAFDEPDDEFDDFGDIDLAA